MTKKTIFLFGSITLIAVLLFWSGLSSCQDASSKDTSIVQKPEDEMAFTLLQLQSDIWGCLNDLDIAVANASHQLSTTGLEGVEARRVLQDLRSSSPYLTEAVTVGLDGKILVVEPDVYSGAEGADISQQGHIIRLFETKNPHLSEVFHTVEEYDAFAIVYPVFTSSGEFMGGISVPIKPANLLEALISPKLNETPYSAWLIQTDSLVLYDRDASEIGKIIFDDPLYQSYTQLLTISRTMTEERSGWGSYVFLADEQFKPVAKEVFWTTVGLHGAEWRLAIIRENPPSSRIY